MQQSQDYDLDVAFSFTAQDEGLATRLNDQLKGWMKTFIYSERQKELAGKDGQETFTHMYSRSARIAGRIRRAG